MTGCTKALALLGGGKQFEQDVLHVFESSAHARERGEQVRVDGIWMPRQSITVTFKDGSEPIETQKLDKPMSRQLALYELMRYENPDIELTERERVMRDIIRQSFSETLKVAPDIARLSMKCTFGELLLRSAGVAVFKGSLKGVDIATGFYHDLRQLGVSE